MDEHLRMDESAPEILEILLEQKRLMIPLDHL
jgi:hypothetical protein